MSDILGAADFYLNRLFFSAGALAVTLLLSYFLKKSIDLVFTGVKRKVADNYVLAKTRTIRSLLKNIIDVALFLVAILIILSDWGINIAPILTGAGILGLAFSFGAQTLVKDLIAGFFIVAENQFNIGDKIQMVAITKEYTPKPSSKKNHLVVKEQFETTAEFKQRQKEELENA